MNIFFKKRDVNPVLFYTFTSTPLLNTIHVQGWILHFNQGSSVQETRAVFSYCPTLLQEITWYISFCLPDVLSLSHGGQESGEVMWRSQQIVNQAGVRGSSQPQHGCPGGPCTPSPIFRCPCPTKPSIPCRRLRAPPQPCPALPDRCLLAAGKDKWPLIYCCCSSRPAIHSLRW